LLDTGLRITLEHGDFVAYVGPAGIHDGVITAVRHRNPNLEVDIRASDGSTILASFRNVTEVQENRAQGMMLYALAEYKRPGALCAFVFANWETDDDAAFSVVAEDVTF
jgi:hypothetical protein